MDLKALHSISYGLYVISSRLEERLNGQIANTVFQITSDPPTVAISINKQNLTNQFIRDSGLFAVSILAEEAPLSLIGQFGFNSGRDLDKFAGFNYGTTARGLPYLKDDVLAYLEARLIQEIDVKTHSIFIGEVTAAEILKKGNPLTYAYYHQAKKGATPPTAPTYIQGGPNSSYGESYQCTVCGYLYDPAEGDPDSNIPPGTPFKKLPDDWVCPLCKAGKDAFKKLD